MQKQLHGKALSFNNIKDADSALSLVKKFKEPAAVAVKHMNPCGVGIGENIEIAFKMLTMQIINPFSEGLLL